MPKKVLNTKQPTQHGHAAISKKLKREIEVVLDKTKTHGK